MALLIRVVYPGGEQVWATGYPDQILVVREIYGGPESCYLDELECDFSGYTTARDARIPCPVLRVVGGPRRPTIHVRVQGTLDEVEAWIVAREAEGWAATTSPGHPSFVWIVADREGLDTSELGRAGGTVVR